MKLLDSLNDLDHHAYCLVGPTSEQVFSILEKKHKIVTRGNPDFFHEKYEMFTVDDSRRIKEMHASKGFVQGGKKIFIIECTGMTGEAQNALLNIFEEPHEHTHFFLLVPSVSFILLTLKSRLLILTNEKIEKDIGEVKKFLVMNVKDKIAFVDDIAKRISDEKIGKSHAVEFLGALESAVHAKGVEKNMKALTAILKARDYMTLPSASVKQLLEFVALSL